MTVLVAIPYWRCAGYIDAAVDAVLAQTYRDLVCLVCGDGETPPVAHPDARLVVVAFPTNLGAPATQQAMLLGSPFGWYAAHGADDWTEPTYLERLMALGTQANGSRALWHDHEDGSRVLVTNDPAYVEFGVFDTDLLRSLGGYGVDRRCGQDTLLYEDILPAFAPVAWCDEPAYHKRIRSGSLTHDPETGFGSAYRNEVVAHNREVAITCRSMRLEMVKGFRERLVPDAMRGQLDDRTAMVQGALS